VTVDASSNVSCSGGSTCHISCRGSCNVTCTGTIACDVRCPGEGVGQTVTSSRQCG
jgi:hypothetical protein